MKKFFSCLKITLIIIALSFLLIEATTSLRSLFTKSNGLWQENLTPKDESTLSPIPVSTEGGFKFDSPNIFVKNCDKNFILTSINNTYSAFANTTEQRYIRITTDTPLLKTADDTIASHTNTFFILPKSYFVKVIRKVTLESGTEGYYVRYNGYEGYAVKTAFLGAMSDNSTMQSGIKINLSDDAGTYLRESPEIKDENKLKLIPSGTANINLVGKIYGEIPSDGSSDLWYFVEYSTGPTTTYTGYIYSERCNLSSPLTDLVLESDKQEVEESTPAPLPLEDTSTTKQESTTEPTLSPSSMWIIAVIFTIPVVIVFILLIKRPRKSDEIITDEITALANTNFSFDEEKMPSVFAKKTNKKFKFKESGLSNLSKFISPSTSLESGEELDPNTSIKSTSNPQESHFHSSYDNIITMQGFTGRSETQSASYIRPNKRQKLRFRKDFQRGATPLANYSSENPSFSNEKNTKTTIENTKYYDLGSDFNPISTSRKENEGDFNPLSPNRKENEHTFLQSLSTDSNQNEHLFESLSTNSGDKDTSFGINSTETCKKRKNFHEIISQLRSRKERNRKTIENRARDEYQARVLSSDDYFEFADSFELTTPINSHYIFPHSRKTTKSLKGKRINPHH